MPPLSDVEYTGLTDTAVGFTGSSTLDSSVDPGSPLPLVIAAHRNAPGASSRRLSVSTYDLWDNPNSMASLQLSGVSDPPFASQGQSTPRPYAAPPAETMDNALHGMSKFGYGIAALLGNHPKTVSPAPSQLHGNEMRVLTHTPPSLTGSSTIILVVVVFTVALLLWRSE